MSEFYEHTKEMFLNQKDSDGEFVFKRMTTQERNSLGSGMVYDTDLDDFFMKRDSTGWHSFKDAINAFESYDGIL